MRPPPRRLATSSTTLLLFASSAIFPESSCFRAILPPRPPIHSGAAASCLVPDHSPRKLAPARKQRYRWSGLAAAAGSKKPDSEARSGASPSAAAGQGRDSVVSAVQAFWDAYNRQNISELLARCEDDVRWDDYDYSEVCSGARALERRLRLEQQLPPWPAAREGGPRAEVRQILVDGSREPGETFVAGAFLALRGKDQSAPPRRGCAVVTFSERTGRARRVELVAEQDDKGGEAKLRLLRRVSPLLSAVGRAPSASNREPEDGVSVGPPREPITAAERYFAAWNRRNMTEALEVFAPDVTYHDTAFAEPFAGRESLRRHLDLCAEAFPPQLAFEVDRVIVSSDAAGGDDRPSRGGGRSLLAQWHASGGDGKALPYTRGCSLYQLNDDGLIESGLDFVEPNGPIKPGGARLVSRTLRSQLERDPKRWIPVSVWLAYMYVVFFSDGILPGASALALEERTWKEVLDLSLNFFLVAPLLRLPFSPAVHPVLEAVFNLLLSWAALFAGFLSDDRRDKPNLLPMGPVVVGMQFLTSAFLLPYLAVRSTETRTEPVRLQEVNRATRWIGENGMWGPFLGSVGSGSILWAFFGRTEDFGTDLAERWSSFLQLLSIDRVGSSFLVDLAIFGVFQGWLVDDDLKRRGYRPGVDPAWLPAVAKGVPFFGLAIYLALRPPLPESDEASR